MEFEPLQRESAVDSCARAMREAILSGQLEAGARLPPERTLAETFGVNRVTVRGALAQLSQARLLSVRQGSGYQVRDYRAAGGPDLIPGLMDVAQSREQLRQVVDDLLRMRRALARAVLDKLAEQPHVPTEAMAAAIDAMERLAQQGGSAAQLAQADLDVLSTIVSATGSAVIRLCMNPIAQVLAAMPELCAASYARPLTNVAGYRALLAWCQAPTREGIDGMVRLLAERDETTLSLLAHNASLSPSGVSRKLIP